MMTGSLIALFGAGLLTFASPCVLPMLPVYLSVLGGAQAVSDPARARWSLRLAGIGFALGLMLVFIALGVGASALASTLEEYRGVMLLVSGGLLILFGAHMLGFLRFGFLDRDARPLLMRTSSSGGFGGGLAFGAAFGLGWTPCVGPVLGAALTYSATGGASLGVAATQLGAYAFGLALPLVAAAFAAEHVLVWVRRLRGATPVLQKAMGGLLIVTGVVMGADRLDLLIPNFGGSEEVEVAAFCDGEDGACAFASDASDGAPLAKLKKGESQLIAFGSNECPACARMAPVISSLEHACAAEGGGEPIVRINVDHAEGRALARSFSVRMLPTFVIIDEGGDEIERFIGEQPEERLALAIEMARGESCSGR